MRIWLKTVAPDAWRGLRAALVTIVPFYLAHAWQRPELCWVAIGGWLGSLVDPGGSRWNRASLIGSFALLGGLSVGCQSLLAPWPVLSIAFLVVVAFAVSLLRALGGSIGSMGTLLLVGTCIAAGRSGGAALRAGPYFALGACIATVFSSVVWRVWTHLPLRRAVAEVLAAQRDYATDLVICARAQTPPADPRWAELARQAQRRVRTALEEARLVSVALRSRRSGESSIGSRLRVLLGDAEAQFGALVAQGALLELEVLRRRQLSMSLMAFADSVSRSRGRLLSASFYDEQTASDHDTAPVSSPLQSSPESGWSSGVHDLPEPFPSLFGRFANKLQILRDNLTLRSPATEHALRVALAVAAAAAVGHWLSPAHVAWVTVTTVAVLQPYPGATARRAAERVVGTVLGSAVALGLIHLVRSPLWLSLTLIPLSAAAVITRPRSYRWFTFFLTPVFVLFSNSDMSDIWTFVLRGADALLGGILALAAVTLIVPSWERERLVVALDRVLGALAIYGAATLHPQRLPRSLSAERRAVGVALGEAETSLERLLSEPLRSRDESEHATQLVTFARRLSNALTALDSLKATPETPDEQRSFAAVSSYVQQVLESARSSARSPAGPKDELPSAPPDSMQPSLRAALRSVMRYAELVQSLPQKAVVPGAAIAMVQRHE